MMLMVDKVLGYRFFRINAAEVGTREFGRMEGVD